MKKASFIKIVFSLFVCSLLVFNMTEVVPALAGKAIKVKKLSIKKSVTIKKGNSILLKPIVKPVKLKNKLKWKSKNKSIATVVKGKVLGKKAGTTKITISLGKKTATCVVRVTKKISPIMPDFFIAKSTDELLKWIKTAKEDDPRQHFLKTVRKLDKLLIVETKDNKFKLNNITVHPERENMLYHFEKGEEYINILVNLSDSLKQGMFPNKSNMSLKDVITQYNKKLEKEFLDLQYKESVFNLFENEINYYYLNGGSYFEKKSGKEKIFSTNAIFETNNTEIEISLLGDLLSKNWDNAYFDMFNFKLVNIK